MIKEFNYNKKWLRIKVETDADLSVFDEIFTNRDYKILEPLIEKATSPILDIGAHIGCFSVFAASINSQIPIYAFEPDERNYSFLKENLKLNNIKNVITKNLAIAKNSGESLLYLSEDSHNHSLFETTEKSKKVFTTSLPDIFKKHSFPNISLAKIDCEGAEFEIIENTPKETLQLIQNIYIEYHKLNSDFDPQKLVQKLAQANFKVTSKSSHYDPKFGFIFAN